MALRSMTGFGRASGETEAWRIDVECKSVNRDRLDVRVHLPSELSHLEPTVRERVEPRTGRGKVDVYVDFEFLGGGDQQAGQFLDPDRFHAVVEELQGLSEKSATGPVTLSEVLEFRDLIERDQPVEIDEQNETLLEAVDAAVDELVAARVDEGEGLEEDLLEYLEDLAEALGSYRERAPEEIASMRQRVEERVREALQDFDDKEPDDDRLAREIVYHADRADVSEELQRAEAHLESLRGLIDTSESAEPVGKEIDFYLQELVRETNTLSSKSISSDLTDLAVSMKSTVEKMREQAANVE